MNKKIVFFSALLFAQLGWAQQKEWKGKFEQLDQLLPTPNEYRSGSGAPGPNYWQQRADYVISVELNDKNQSITGDETITYFNNSPEALTYLWLQLDQNINAKDNMTWQTKTNAVATDASVKEMQEELLLMDPAGGYTIRSVKDGAGKDLPYVINHTMMRIDLPQPLAPGKQFAFTVAWSYNIPNRMLDATPNDGRSGYEYFPEDDNYVYGIAQFFPRMCVFDDYEGWQNKQFLGQGEFALVFGNYKVKITVPADHIVAATGMLQNPKDVLTGTELTRFEKAKTSFDKPVVIVTQQEATLKEKTKSEAKKTWEFAADNVRDFAFASSRKFIWDAMAVKVGNKTPLAMSYYPKEGNPLWEQESTKAVKNTLVTYSKYTIDYPYPQATSVHFASIGMEYPMICFNFGRPEKDGTYSDRVKYGMIGVVIHEVGHNFFPMIINNDERQWTWMDEGLNSFVQYLTQVEGYDNFPHRRGPAPLIVPYMKGDGSLQRPLMVNSETVVRSNFGNEQYAKCATALNILRETVMGHELFDKSFKEYAQRWAFKHPSPGDFFRTMEDASAVDLDWFWRGWFYTTDNVDIAVSDVKWYRLKQEKADVENKTKKVTTANATATGDFTGGPQPLTVIPSDERLYGEFRSRIDDKAVINKLENKNLYEVTLENKGGLVMPVIVEWTFADGTKEIERIPAEIWRINENKVTKVFVKQKEVVAVVVDPNGETADVNTEDNVFPKTAASKFEEFKKRNN